MNTPARFRKTLAYIQVAYFLVIFVLVLLLTTGCETVEFYQKQHLVNEIMVFGPDPAEVHFAQKVHYSREGSIGGIGTGAGGGCGCY